MEVELNFDEWWINFVKERCPTLPIVYWLESEKFCAQAAWDAAQEQLKHDLDGATTEVEEVEAPRDGK